MWMERGRSVADYLFKKYKGVYRVLPELCLNTHDFPRDEHGNIDVDAETYIPCKSGGKISYWGLNSSRKAVLIAYIPSIGRGRNIKKALKKEKVEIFNYDESDEEVWFHFFASDVEPVASLMGARTSGANTSPFSPKNLGKRKDVKIPDEDIAKYKSVIDMIDKKNMLVIHKITNNFLDNVLQKKLKKSNKAFDWKVDSRKMQLSRQIKEYIWVKNFWEEYLDYLNSEVDKLK